ncbi:hypothetical protein AX768_13390 [Burkholderia sp. PAMC 28687]|uniref:hypothetical protein n=1 Tax=Burkholderia sp. PAMC 28687 TaxID=1795874 RepID=UPI000782177B|nr:hypothetical protein [Burkholderia sp. PAMC 28687]AMM14943.1 hypothetical protein AX768_13390 [Burkholderia sp. PAMC 28687]
MAQKLIIEVSVTGFGLADLVDKGQITQYDADQIEADARQELHDVLAAHSHLARHRYVVRTGAQRQDIDDL